MKGFIKDDKFHPIRNQNGMRKSRDQYAKIEGVKLDSNVRMKRDEGRKIKSHLYRIYSTWDSEDDGDREETAHVRARNMDEAIEFIKKDFFKQRVQNDLQVDGDGEETAYITTSYAVDDKGNELSENEVEEIQQKEGDEAVRFVTEGFEIIQDDEEEDNYHTIYGGNDFYDLTKPKGEQKGFTSEDAIKKAGGIEKAFFKLGSGQGFESGNPKNDYNLNNPNLKLYDPTKNEFTKSTKKDDNR